MSKLCVFAPGSGGSSGGDAAVPASGGAGGSSGGASSTGGRIESGGATTSSGGSDPGGSTSSGGVSSSTGGSSGSGGSLGSVPLDMYIMFDQSGSMSNVESSGSTRMDAVRTALGTFVKEPESSGIGVGIGYFGYQLIGQSSCDPADYENPDVVVGALPGNADAIMYSLNARQPEGETPTGAAIRGACTYAKSWKTAHPGRKVVILLLTDGNPQAPVTCSGLGTCCPTLDDAVAATTDCLSGTPGVQTYVLGVGTLLDNLEQIAVAGGTSKAYLVSGGTDVISALSSIRDAAKMP